MRLVEHQEVESSAGEELDVGLPRQEKLELLHVGEEDARLHARRAELLARGPLLRGEDVVLVLGRGLLRQQDAVVRPTRAAREARPANVGAAGGSGAGVEREGDVRPREEVAQTPTLVGRQSVHWVDDHRDDARRRALVSESKAPVDDRVEEGLGLARPGARRHERVGAPEHRADGRLLMAEEVRVGVERAEIRVEHALGDEVLDRLALPEGAGQ